MYCMTRLYVPSDSFKSVRLLIHMYIFVYTYICIYILTHSYTMCLIWNNIHQKDKDKRTAIKTTRTTAIKMTHCNSLQLTATHCNTLQHTATHCNSYQKDSVSQCATVACSVWQRLAMCRSVLHCVSQCVAVSCSVTAIQKTRTILVFVF